MLPIPNILSSLVFGNLIKILFVYSSVKCMLKLVVMVNLLHSDLTMIVLEELSFYYCREGQRFTYFFVSKVVLLFKILSKNDKY